MRPTVATDRPADIGPVDVVLLGVKTWQVEDAARAMGPLLGPETFVVPLQNGVEAAGQLSRVLGPERVVGGLCATFSWIAAPGRIRSLGQVHSLRFGELDRRPSARTERLRETFERAGIRATIPPDIEVSLWEKLLIVVPFGGVGAVTRVPIGVIRSMPETRRLLERGMEEIFAVGRARGVAPSRRGRREGDGFRRLTRPVRHHLAAARHRRRHGRPSSRPGTGPSCVSGARRASRRPCTSFSTRACCPWSAARGPPTEMKVSELQGWPQESELQG